MNAPLTKPETTELQVVQATLDALMTAVIEHDHRPRPVAGKGDRFEVLSIADLAREFDEDQARSRAGRYVHRLRNDPVRYALVFAVRQCGKRLYEIGGNAAMLEACNRQEDYPYPMHRVSIIDARWDGIGDWVA